MEVRSMYFSAGAKIIRLAFLMTLVLCSSPFVFCQTLESKLNQKVEAFDSESSSTIKQLIELAQQFQIPMGVEWLLTTDEKSVRPVHVRKALLRDVLKVIVQQQPGYQFTLRDGIVHVFATSLINDRRDFLNLVVPSFSVDNESLVGANHYLRLSIKLLLHPSPGFGGGYGGVGLNNNFAVRNITFSGSNLTVRQILSKIAALQGNALWVVRLKSSEMMKKEPFYAQTVSFANEQVASDFAWQFIPLKEVIALRLGPQLPGLQNVSSP
jgi:hypothetical protein